MAELRSYFACYDPRSVLWAIGAAIQGWGFFETAGLPAVDWGEWAWSFMVAIWGLALLVVRRRYA